MAAEDYFDLFYLDEEYEYQFDKEAVKKLTRKAQRKGIFQGLNMAKKTNSNKPTLVKVGKHYINPRDVRCISEVRSGLYIVKFLSENNPQFACWVDDEDEIAFLLNEFNIKVDD